MQRLVSQRMNCSSPHVTLAGTHTQVSTARTGRHSAATGSHYSPQGPVGDESSSEPSGQSRSPSHTYCCSMQRLPVPPR